uniref:X8 domain-containing protein n=1 Tax=Angiostrongylus cantonensis TaxID=6313 RepID=A0A0K0D727_ANGCA
RAFVCFDISGRDLTGLNVCPLDPGGYFVIGAFEMVAAMQICNFYASTGDSCGTAFRALGSSSYCDTVEQIIYDFAIPEMNGC